MDGVASGDGCALPGDTAVAVGLTWVARTAGVSVAGAREMAVRAGLGVVNVVGAGAVTQEASQVSATIHNSLREIISSLVKPASVETWRMLMQPPGRVDAV
jgi:hypothetical protein